MNKSALTQSKPIVIVPEKQALTGVEKKARLNLKTEFRALAAVDSYSFLVVPIEALAKYIPTILASYNKLRIIFVICKSPKGAPKINFLLDKIVQTNSEKILPKLFVTDDFEEINRVLHAWCDGVESSTISEAWIDDDALIVKTCALERLQISFNQLPWLAKIPAKQRDNFEVDSFGRHLHWPKQNVHLNIDAIRCAIDANYRKKRDIEALTKNTNYGQAIARFRKQSGLSQQDIMRKTGVTDRQLRRVEKQGHPLSVQMVEHLARAHDLSPNEFLKAVAKVSHSE